MIRIPMPCLLLLMLSTIACKQNAGNKEISQNNKPAAVANDTTNAVNPTTKAAVVDTILFDKAFKIPSNVELNIGFELGGKLHRFYGSGAQYSEMDGTLFTEFSIDGNIFPQTSYDYGEGDMPDGMSLVYNDKAITNKAMELDTDKSFLKMNGLNYVPVSGTMTITQVKHNRISGVFSVKVHAKAAGIIAIEGGHFENVPVQNQGVENE